MDFNIAVLVEATASRIPERLAMICGEDSWTYQQLLDRSHRLAAFLNERGLGAHRERDELSGHESGQDFLAQYLHNGPAYLEGLLGTFGGRLAPLNINYRYVADELAYVFRDSRPAVIQYHATFAPVLAQALKEADLDALLLQVADGSEQPLLPGALDYEQALASVSDDSFEPFAGSPDDLYTLFTGGTTGMPKVVLWRQSDIAVAGFGIRNRRADREWESLEERLSAIPRSPMRMMPLAPFMHGAAQWVAMQALCEGNTLVIPSQVDRFDAEDVWATVERHSVNLVTIVGDAFARPMADAIEKQPRDLPSLRFIFSGGAALSPTQKRRLQRAVPGVTIVETIGSSESGTQGRAEGVGDDRAGRPIFDRAASTVVVSEDMARLLEPGHEGTGWLATLGRVPLGYYGDADKTARTFPVVDGVRLSVPGDRARLLAGDRVELLGRDSMTINTGGEKVFAEEVELAVKAQADVADVVVCGRPSERWGSEVVAIVEPRAGSGLTAERIVSGCADLLARYKLPKVVVFVDKVQRAANGKADYRWARTVATEAPAEPR